MWKKLRIVLASDEETKNKDHPPCIAGDEGDKFCMEHDDFYLC